MRLRMQTKCYLNLFIKDLKGNGYKKYELLKFTIYNIQNLKL